MGLKPRQRRPRAAAAEPTALVLAFDNEWHDCVPISRSQISAVEEALALTFPPPLVILFLSCNAGHPAKSFYGDDRVEIEIGRLLPIDEYEAVHQSWSATTGLPSSLMPFAYDTGNANLFCVDADSGEVVYWLHDEPERRRLEVAPSLGHLLANLATPPY